MNHLRDTFRLTLAVLTIVSAHHDHMLESSIYTLAMAVMWWPDRPNHPPR